ncbi:von Willebrand factor type A domain-containing protein [Lutibacter oricola]|uniref:von Willebrand factor type A domain-containing protein n=1 Tax=Lutibacter oricola TaxID=762486 RepID=A0A1H3C6N8_9FLAO|nr:vWA domain-containing protein [Lutibacter oricola]SDX49304.1 von Willebrand factor type A domain-containing protein [Lutibacter oricola]
MKTYLPLLLSLFIAFQINAQKKTITGVVTDETQPLPGVSILIKGTSEGVVTNFDGQYSIEASKGDTLVYSFVGMNTVELKVEDKLVINVKMIANAACLDEVVVVGYGTSRKKSITGAVSSVVIRGASSIKKESYNGIKAGTLTAGEINDINKWQEWNSLSKRKYENKWGFYLNKKLTVVLKDENKNVLNNVKVYLYTNENEKVAEVKTDINGEALFFYGVNLKKKAKNYIVKVPFDNKVYGKILNNGTKKINLRLPTKSKVKNAVDIMFTIDATGSMGDEISYLKTELTNIIDRVGESEMEKRLGLVFYRDEGDDYVIRDFDFTTNLTEVQENLMKQSAAGGGDFEEAVEKALEVSIAKQWSEDAKSRMLFLLLDAPPHFTEKNVEIIKSQINKAIKKGIKIIPIVASDSDKDLEFLMRFFSISTNGTCVFLTDDSGVGNSHLEPSTDSYKVEKLNDLIVRLINKYTNA